MDTPVLIGSYWDRANRTGVVRDADFIGSMGSLYSLFQTFSKHENSPCISQGPVDDSHLVYKTGSLILEGEIAWSGTSAKMIQDWCIENMYTTYLPKFGEFIVAPDNVLYMLKLSHRFRDSVHFDKTRNDILEFESRGFSEEELDSELKEILRVRTAETLSAPVNLKVSKSEFFSNDGVDYKYDHDRIHEAIALDGVPAYSKVKSSDSDVFMTRAEFESAPYQVQMNCVLEEAMVLALERSIVPQVKLFTATQTELDEAMDISLRKICTRITSGYFREFAWRNLDEIRTMYSTLNIDYARIMREKLNVR